MYLNRSFFKMALGFVLIIFLGIVILAGLAWYFEDGSEEVVPPLDRQLTDA